MSKKVIDSHKRVGPAETVADRYDLDVGDVYRALAYYHDHSAEMARVEREREAAERRAAAAADR